MLYIAYSFVFTNFLTEFVHFRHLLTTYRIPCTPQTIDNYLFKGGGGGHFLRIIKSLINVYAIDYPVSLINQVPLLVVQQHKIFLHHCC